MNSYLLSGRILLSVFMTVFAFPCVKAQTGQTFLKEGKEWKYEIVGIRYETTENGESYAVRDVFSEYSHFVEGDTLVDGQSYKKMVCVPWDKFIGNHIVREDGSKVYGTYFVLAEEPEKICLLFDFGMSVGDTWEEGLYSPKAIDAHVINIRGINRKVISFDKGHYIVEGIGHVVDESVEGYQKSCGWMPKWPLLLLDYTTNGYFYPICYYDFQSCWEDGVCIFSKNEDMEVIRSAATAVKEVQKASPSGVFYDLQGRRVTGQPKRGIYIKNGRKVTM